MRSVAACLRLDRQAACPSADSSEPDRPQAAKGGAVALPLRGFGLDGLMPPQFRLSSRQRRIGGAPRSQPTTKRWRRRSYYGPLDYLFAGPECIVVRVTGCQSQSTRLRQDPELSSQRRRRDGRRCAFTNEPTPVQERARWDILQGGPDSGRRGDARVRLSASFA